MTFWLQRIREASTWYGAGLAATAYLLNLDPHQTALFMSFASALIVTPDKQHGQ